MINIAALCKSCSRKDQIEFSAGRNSSQQELPVDIGKLYLGSVLYCDLNVAEIPGYKIISTNAILQIHIAIDLAIACSDGIRCCVILAAYEYLA